MEILIISALCLVTVLSVIKLIFSYGIVKLDPRTYRRYSKCWWFKLIK